MCGFFSTLILLVEKNFCSWEFFLKKRFEDSTRRVIGETTRNVPFLPLNCLLSNKPCPTNGGTSHFYLLSPFPSLDSLMGNGDFSRIFILATIIRFSTQSEYPHIHTGAKILNSSKKSHFKNLIFDKIHIIKISFFTKFTIYKFSFFT